MTTDVSETQEFVKLFIELARKSINTSERNINYLKTKDYSKKEVDDLERAFHTLKGQAGVLNFQKIAKVCDRAEEVLRKARETDTKLSEQQLDDIDNILSGLRNSIASIEKTGK